MQRKTKAATQSPEETEQQIPQKKAGHRTEQAVATGNQFRRDARRDHAN